MQSTADAMDDDAEDDDAEDDDANDLMTPLLTLMLMTTNTETIAKPMLCTPEQSHATAHTLSNTLPLSQSTADIATDDFHMLMPQETMLPLTTVPRSEKTKQTMTCTTHQPNATAPTSRNISPLPQSNAHNADEADKDYPRMMWMMQTMLTTKPRTKMPMTETMEKTVNCPTHQPYANAPTFSNPPSPMQPPTDNITDNAEDNFPMMMLPGLHNTILDAKIHDPLISHSDPATNWIRDSFAPVFKALDRLTLEMANLSDSLFAATSNLSMVAPPTPPTPNPQTQGIQPQLLCPSYDQPNPKEIFSHKATNLANRSQPPTHQQNPDPQQTLHSHRNHTKYRNLLNPSLPILHPHFSKRLPFPVQIHPPPIIDT